MASSAPPPSPPHNGGRGQGCAPRGWEVLRTLQVRLLRRPHSGLNAEGNMPNHHNPGRYRGGGAPIEFVRGGMGRGRRTSYFVNRSGRGTNMQHRNSLGAMPDCVPQSENYHHPDEQPQLQEGEDIGSGRQTEEVLGNLPTVYVADSGSGRQAEEVMCDLSTVHVPDSGLNAASPVPSIPVLSCVTNDPHTGQNATNLMRPIPILQTVTALNQAMIGNSTVYAVGPVLPPEQTHNTVLIQNVIQATIPTEIQPSTTNDTYTEQNIIEVQNILEHSTLSPNAKEFVPLSKYKLSQLSSSDTYSKEVEMDSSNYNSSFLDTQEIFGSNDKENSDQMTTSNGAYGCKERLDDNLLENWSYTEMVETLQLVQCELIKHPASFNNMMRNITPALLQWLQSNLALPMVDFIISMATQQDNFSYMAARICIFVNNLDPSNVFRTNLIEKCHAICQNIGEERKCASFLGFVMFLAELYVQFKNETGQRVDVIGTGLLECLENLISEPVVFDNLKFFCNALKLAGYYLDTNLNSAMNQLMTHIQSVMTAVGLDNMDKRIYNQLQRLIDMRNNNWDNQGAASLETQELDGTNNSNSATYYSDAVFYGPDGQVLTLEESQFLNENQSLAECSQNECDEDSCKEDSGDSMDEEMQDAYEQFLQMVPEAR